MANVTFYGAVTTSGILSISNRKRLQTDLIKLKGSNVICTIKKNNTRTNKQSRYYWGVVVKEVQLRLIELGNDVTPELTHDFLKDKFNEVTIMG